MDGQQVHGIETDVIVGPIERAGDDIGKAMLRVYRAVGYVQKTGYNERQRYNYAGEEQMIEAIRPALVAEGIIHYPASIENIHVTETPRGDKDKGGISTHVVARFTFAFLHAPSGTSIKIQVLGEGTDSLDKAVYKAMTGALKYGLRQPLLMQCGNDPDEAHEEKNAKAAEQRLLSEAEHRLWAARKLDRAGLAELGGWLRERDSQGSRAAWIKQLDGKLYQQLTDAMRQRGDELGPEENASPEAQRAAQQSRQ